MCSKLISKLLSFVFLIISANVHGIYFQKISVYPDHASLTKEIKVDGYSKNSDFCDYNIVGKSFCITLNSSNLGEFIEELNSRVGNGKLINENFLIESYDYSAPKIVELFDLLCKEDSLYENESSCKYYLETKSFNAATTFLANNLNGYEITRYRQKVNCDNVNEKIIKYAGFDVYKYENSEKVFVIGKILDLSSVSVNCSLFPSDYKQYNRELQKPFSISNVLNMKLSLSGCVFDDYPVEDGVIYEVLEEDGSVTLTHVIYLICDLLGNTVDDQEPDSLKYNVVITSQEFEKLRETDSIEVIMLHPVNSYSSTCSYYHNPDPLCGAPPPGRVNVNVEKISYLQNYSHYKECAVLNKCNNRPMIVNEISHHKYIKEIFDHHAGVYYDLLHNFVGRDNFPGHCRFQIILNGAETKARRKQGEYLYNTIEIASSDTLNNPAYDATLLIHEYSHLFNGISREASMSNLQFDQNCDLFRSNFRMARERPLRSLYNRFHDYADTFSFLYTASKCIGCWTKNYPLHTGDYDIPREVNGIRSYPDDMHRSFMNNIYSMNIYNSLVFNLKELLMSFYDDELLVFLQLFDLSTKVNIWYIQREWICDGSDEACSYDVHHGLNIVNSIIIFNLISSKLSEQLIEVYGEKSYLTINGGVR